MDSEQIKTRSRTQKHTKAKKDGSVGKGKTSKRKKSKNAFWLLLIVLAFITFIIGSMVGYSLMGNRDPLEILNVETWKHMYDLIFK